MVSCRHSQSTLQLRVRKPTDSHVIPLTKWQCYHTGLHSNPDVDCQVAYSYRTLSKYKCSGFLCCVCHLISLSSWPFLWLICELVQVLFLSFVINFYSFNSHFPVTTHGIDLFSSVYLNMFTVSMMPSDWEQLNIRGLPVYVLFCLKMETESASKMPCFFKKLDGGQNNNNNKKRSRLCQLTLVMFCSLIYLHVMIWWWHWCGSSWYGLALHMQI